MDLNEITSYIHEHIPMTSHIGAIVESYNGETVVIAAPLAPNLNHRNTAFNGSLSALGILSGWVLLFLKLKKNGIKNRLIIRNSSYDFFDSIDDDFRATCTLPPPEKWEKFMQTLKKRGRSRIALHSEIKSSAGTGGTHEGTYVAIVLEDNEN